MDQKLQDVVAKVLDLHPEQVTDDLERGKLESWDSLSHLLLISELESVLGIEFTTEEVLGIRSFKDIREIVANKIIRK